MKIGARGTPAFRWKPSHLSIGPLILWLTGMAVLLLVRVLVRDPQGYASTVGFVVPFIDFAWILGPILVTLMSGGELKDLGITRRYGVLALALGLIVGFAIMGVRSLDPRFAGYSMVHARLAPALALILGGAFHAFAEEVLFRGYMVGRLSRDFGWVPAVIISGISYGLMPFAYLGADPAAISQISEIGKFFGSVFPAVLLMGIMLALVYRIIGNVICNWFGVSLSIWTLGFIRGGIISGMNFPLFSFAGYIALTAAALLIARKLLIHYGKKTLTLKDIKDIVE